MNGVSDYHVIKLMVRLSLVQFSVKSYKTTVQSCVYSSQISCRNPALCMHKTGGCLSKVLALMMRDREYFYETAIPIKGVGCPRGKIQGRISEALIILSEAACLKQKTLE